MSDTVHFLRYSLCTRRFGSCLLCSGEGCNQRNDENEGFTKHGKFFSEMRWVLLSKEGLSSVPFFNHANGFFCYAESTADFMSCLIRFANMLLRESWVVGYLPPSPPFEVLCWYLTERGEEKLETSVKVMGNVKCTCQKLCHRASLLKGWFVLTGHF